MFSTFFLPQFPQLILYSFTHLQECNLRVPFNDTLDITTPCQSNHWTNKIDTLETACDDWVNASQVLFDIQRPSTQFASPGFMFVLTQISSSWFFLKFRSDAFKWRFLIIKCTFAITFMF